MEFEFTKGSLEAAGLVVGDRVKCTYSDDVVLTAGKVYTIYDDGGRLIVIDNALDAVRDYVHLVKFKPIKEEQPSIDPDVAVQRLEAVIEYVNKKLDFLNSNGVQSFQLNEVKRLMNGE